MWKNVQIAAIFASILTGFGGSGSWAAEIIKPRAVVELFTSQGCSSCPPADEILGKLAEEGEVLALGWHVDYWDYLGWKDKFANATHTERQKFYARSFQEPQVYTPQAIINGLSHTVGSRESEIRDLVSGKIGVGSGQLPVTINAAVSENVLSIDVPISTEASGATLWLVYFNNQSDVYISHGENRGRTITYHNIVGKMEMLGMMKPEGLSVELPVSEMKRQGYDSCGLLLQTTDPQGYPGKIVGAAIISDL